MKTMLKRPLEFKKFEHGHLVSFRAMASPCELLINSHDVAIAKAVANIASHEAWRIEEKFSRYQTGNIVDTINQSNGKAVALDPETNGLLQYAHHAFQISDGLFDITSGVLRKVWHFDGSDNIPSQSTVNVLLKHIGWSKIVLSENHITLPINMQIDLGGIGKEYAVDSAARLVKQFTDVPVLINFGGDLCTTGMPSTGFWAVGVSQVGHSPDVAIKLSQGGLATSGDANRFLHRNGKRYSHLLNPQTGWPINQAPRSVTVASPTCMESGMLATLAMLNGQDAELFLEAQNVLSWVQR